MKNTETSSKELELTVAIRCLCHGWQAKETDIEGGARDEERERMYVNVACDSFIILLPLFVSLRFPFVYATQISTWVHENNISGHMQSPLGTSNKSSIVLRFFSSRFFSEKMKLFRTGRTLVVLSLFICLCVSLFRFFCVVLESIFKRRMKKKYQQPTKKYGERKN